MPDIAEVDFSTLKCGDIREEAIALHQRLQDAKEKDPDAEQYPLRYRSGVPHNNAIDVALRKYVRDYKGPAPKENLKIAGRVLQFFCSSRDNPDRTALDVLDEMMEESMR